MFTHPPTTGVNGDQTSFHMRDITHAFSSLAVEVSGLIVTVHIGWEQRRHAMRDADALKRAKTRLETEMLIDFKCAANICEQSNAQSWAAAPTASHAVLNAENPKEADT